MTSEGEGWLPNIRFTLPNNGTLEADSNSNNIYHIRVIPMAGPRVGHDDVLVVSVVVYDRLDRGPRVLDVVKVAPQIAVLYDRCEVRLEREN